MKHSMSFASFKRVFARQKLETDGDEEDDLLFWLDRCKDSHGNEALVIRVDLQKTEDEANE